jgi:redox-sensitive bicupin YhaK (pirin superfamily)
MTAASGILHKEYHEAEWARQGGPFQMAQLWVNLPRAKKMSTPGYQAIEAAEIPEVQLPEGAGSVRVIAGELLGARGAARTHSPMNVWDVRLRAQARVELPLPASHNAGLVVMHGGLRMGERSAVMHDFVVFHGDGAHLSLEATEETQLLVLAGEPLREPVVSYGPFVMSSRQEIVQAIEDFNGGKFGHLE